MELVAGIDMGTSYFKVGLFDRGGRLVGLGRKPVKPDIAVPGYCELPVGRFWDMINSSISQAAAQAGAEPDSIKSISYSSQANSFVLLDRQYQPITPIILWPDQRAGKIDESIRRLWETPDVMHITGLGNGWSNKKCITKLKWIQKNDRSLWSQVGYIMTISDYLMYCLTGNRIGDSSTASLLGIYDLTEGVWWRDALEQLGFDENCFSEPLPPGTVAGTLSSDGARMLGLFPSGQIVTVGSLDHYAAAMGAGVPAIAPVSLSIGTVLACIACCNTLDVKKGICVGAVADNSYYKLASSVNGAGQIEWYQKNYAPHFTIPELLHCAETIPPDIQGIKALPCADKYDGLEGFHNVAPHHEHGHFARAMLESSAKSIEHIIKKVSDPVPSRIVATGGGARNKFWIEVVAEMLQTEIRTTDCPEPACRGAAMLAAHSLGWFNDSQEQPWIVEEHAVV